MTSLTPRENPVNNIIDTVSKWGLSMSWSPRIESFSGPKYLAICDALEHDIEAGNLKPSQRLPPHRDLAYKLGVTTGTIARAYAEAAKRGLVIGEVGRGTYINDQDNDRQRTSQLVVNDSGSSEFMDLGLNLAAATRTERVLRDTLAEIANSKGMEALLSYQPANGLRRHREAVVSWLHRSKLNTHHDNVMICNGAQHGILLSVMALLKPGEKMAVETLTYPGVKAVAHQLGVNLVGLPMDEFGLVPEALREACKQKSVSVLYCIPVLHNPTTVTMPQQRVNEIAAIAEEFGLWVIEDDVYGFLSDSRPLPIAEVLPDRTIYVSSASKSMAPGLRSGFLVVPKPLQHIFNAVATTSNWMASPLSTEVFVRWMCTGYADKLIDLHRREAAERQQVAREALGPFSQNAPDISYHLWLNLPEQWRMDIFARTALDAGIRVLTADTFSVRSDFCPHAVRLCLGPAYTVPDIRSAVNLLAGILKSVPQPRMDLSILADAMHNLSPE